MLYLVWFRVAPLAGCKVTGDGFDPALEAIVAADDPAAIAERVDTALRHHRYLLEHLEHVEPWDAERPENRALADAARRAEAHGIAFASLGRGPGDAANGGRLQSPAGASS